MNRREELKEIFKDVDESQRKLVQPLINEVLFLEEQMTELKQFPFISVHPTKPTLQKKTEAAKLYKECSQSYMNAIRILCSLLHKDEGGEEDPVAKFMENLNG